MRFVHIPTIGNAISYFSLDALQAITVTPSNTVRIHLIGDKTYTVDTTLDALMQILEDAGSKNKKK